MIWRKIYRTAEARPERVMEVVDFAGAASLEVCAVAVLAALRRPPWHCVVPGVDADEAGTLVPRLLHVLWHAAGALPLAQLSCARVEVDPLAPLSGGAVTALGQPLRAMALHSDSCSAEVPDDLLVLQLIRADTTGGITFLAPQEEIRAALDPETQARLRLPVFPFGERCHAVFEGQGDGTTIRYSRQQILHAVHNGWKLPDASVAAMRRLDQVLSDPTLPYRRHMAPGDVLFINNRKALHGRSALGEASARLMLRYRMHLQGLSGSVAA